jgi:histidinol-phosphatase (PHP family)
MICDLHVHTLLSADSKSDIDLTITKAIDLGMKYLAITDHHDFEYEDYTFEQDPFNYYNTIKSFREKYINKIELLIGIEIGLEKKFTKELIEFTKSVPFDFVIGSSHLAFGSDPYYPLFWENKDEISAMNNYFSSILENLSLYDDFDVYGHLDYAIRYAPLKDSNYKYSDYVEIIDKILLKIIAMGKGIEINTGGLRKNLKSTNPSEEIVKRYHELGGRIITVGSDAHSPNDIGADFDIAKSILLNAGFEKYCVFKDRKPVFIDIN